MSEATSKRKSIALTKNEFMALKLYGKKFKTVVECAEMIGIHRNVLDRVYLTGTGSPDTIDKIRLAISVSDIGEGDK